MAVVDPNRTWEPLEKRLAETTNERHRVTNIPEFELKRLTVDDHCLHSGPVSVTKLSREDLPQKYIDLAPASA